MANQEGVKIVITAEDRFTENIKKIEASTKLFGETAKNTERYLAALEKEMIRLVANGLDPASAKIQEMKANYDRLSQSIDGNNNALKESNKKWTSLALVVQDLPYGFRGIQNNLPALFGSIASAAGPAYLAFSAIVAAITYFDQESSKAADSTNKLYESFNKLKTETLAVGSIFSAVRQGTLSASDATKIYNDKLGDLYGTAKNVYEAEALYVRKTEGYIKAQYFRAKADIEYEKAKEALAKKDAAYGEDQVGVLGKIALAASAFFKGGALQGIAGLYKTGSIFAKDLANQQVELAGYVTDREEAEFQKRLALGERYMSEAYKIEQQYGIKSANLKDETTKKGAKPKVKKEKEDILDILKTTKEFYDTKLNFAEGDEAAQKDILLRQKETLDELINGNQISWNDYFTNVSQIYKKLVDFQTKEDKRLLDSQTDAQKQTVKNINAQLNATLKATRGNYEAQKSAIQDAINKNKEFRESAIKAGEGTKVFDDAIVNLENQIAGLVDPIEQLEINFNTVINSLATGALVELGTQIGNVFTGVGFSIDGFLSIIADGLIKLGTYLVTISKLYLAIQALFASGGALAGWAIPIGLAAIAAGIALKSSLSKDSVPKFANGGIVSGPTLGLMGEYPGASSNPEVIAPLDKLKGLIGGGGGGTLTARISGNDLLILMNKASRTNSTTF